RSHHHGDGGRGQAPVEQAGREVPDTDGVLHGRGRKSRGSAGAPAAIVPSGRMLRCNIPERGLGACGRGATPTARYCAPHAAPVGRVGGGGAGACAGASLAAFRLSPNDPEVTPMHIKTLALAAAAAGTLLLTQPAAAQFA